jgi:hypothetical protein
MRGWRFSMPEYEDVDPGETIVLDEELKDESF